MYHDSISHLFSPLSSLLSRLPSAVCRVLSAELPCATRLDSTRTGLVWFGLNAASASVSQLRLVEARMVKYNASSPLRMRMRMPVRENLYEIRWVRVGSGVMPVTSQRLRLQRQLVRPSLALALALAQLRAVGRVESSRIGEVGWHRRLG